MEWLRQLESIEQNHRRRKGNRWGQWFKQHALVWYLLGFCLITLAGVWAGIRYMQNLVAFYWAGATLSMMFIVVTVIFSQNSRWKYALPYMYALCIGVLLGTSLGFLAHVLEMKRFGISFLFPLLFTGGIGVVAWGMAYSMRYYVFNWKEGMISALIAYSCVYIIGTWLFHGWGVVFALHLIGISLFGVGLFYAFHRMFEHFSLNVTIRVLFAHLCGISLFSLMVNVWVLLMDR